MGDLTDERADRRTFARRLGTTLAVGLGVGLVGARSAFGAQSYCCPDSTHCSCQPFTGNPWLCGGGCGGCCACLNRTGGCFWFSGGCPC
jgi:hypothetical protein